MSTSANIKPARATSIRFTAHKMVVLLADERELAVPLDWFPKLRDAGRAEREKWRLIGNGIGVHWESLDEDISIERLLH